MRTSIRTLAQLISLSRLAALLTLLCVLHFLTARPAFAAAISIDDTSPPDAAGNETITVSANDFEFGLSLNGAPFQTGLGNPASITLPEAPLSFNGTWITDGGQAPASGTLYFVESPFNPTQPAPLISDILTYQIIPNGDGFTATLNLNFQSDINDDLGTVPPGTDPNSVFLETGQPVSLNFVGLSVGATSDVNVPEPSTICLVALGLVGLATIGRRRG